MCLFMDIVRDSPFARLLREDSQIISPGGDTAYRTSHQMHNGLASMPEHLW